MNQTNSMDLKQIFRPTYENHVMLQA